MIAFGCLSEAELHTIHYPSGDVTHCFAPLFLARAWRGDPQPDSEESTEAGFFDLGALPEPLHSPTTHALEGTIDGRIELVLPRPVLVELERILAEDRLRARSMAGGRATTRRPRRRTRCRPSGPTRGDQRRPDDDLILACAVKAGVEVPVSGDRRHLLPLGDHRGVRIITPQALLAELQGG